MKINNSAELTELIQQAVLMMMNKHGTVVLIHEDVSFSDFEKETFQVAENLWQSFEAGTLDISDSNAPSNADVIDYLESWMSHGESPGSI
jgi:hypothetical protein